MANESLIGIISDTHDNLPAIRKAVDAFIRSNCALVIHAGDYIAPFTAQEFKRLTSPFIGVFGNNDGEKNGLIKAYTNIGKIHEQPCEFTFQGKRFVLMHDPDNVETFSASDRVDVVIYGHLHKVDLRLEKPLIINPGECCSWLTGKSTVALLDCMTMRADILEL